jgi:Ca2+-binding RTX toxin-like protein
LGGGADQFVDVVPHSGNDRIYGGSGRDGIAALGGHDDVYGGRGDDPCLMTKDGAHGDLVRGGPGVDRAFADVSDDVRAERHSTSSIGCDLLD